MKKLKRIYQKFVYNYLLDEENKSYIKKYNHLLTCSPEEFNKATFRMKAIKAELQSKINFLESHTSDK